MPSDQPVCPECGMPNPNYVAPAPEGDSTEDGSEAAEKERTTAIPRIESAVPADPDNGASIVRDRLPRTRVIITSLVVGVLAMSAVVLAITHPWDPNAFDTKAKTEADTSMAGFPGTVSELQGQDSNGSSSEEVKSGDQATYEKLSDVYSKLGELSSKVDQNEDLFNQVGASGSLDDRKKGKAAADELSIEISNLISSIDSVDVTSGTYADDANNLKTLGSWLRNRMDALSSAWDVSVSYDDAQANAGKIKAPLYNSDGASVTESYRKLFNDSYSGWKPADKNGS